MKRPHHLILLIKKLGRKLITSYNVELLPAADADLDDIFDYILLDSPYAADKVLTRIFPSLSHLENFPFAGTKLIESTLSYYEFRMIISDPYRGCSKSPIKMTHRISSLACFSVTHVLVAYVPLLKASPPRTSWSFLFSFLNTHLYSLLPSN